MYRYKITIEYSGEDLYGWQIQKDKATVQGCLENAIHKIIGKKIRVLGAGRTDSGVHALAQVAHFDLEKYHDPYKLLNSINHFIYSKKILIYLCEIVEENFHARYSAKQKHYKYLILNQSHRSVFDEKRSLWIRDKIELEKIQLASRYLIGVKDFSSFRSSSCQARLPISNIRKINIYRESKYIHFDFSGKSFLHHMIRNIVGTLVQIGRNIRSYKEMENILNAKDRSLAGPTSYASGLYLTRVEY